MVDKALFLGSDGESSAMHQLQIITNNLANVNTTGFRADYESMKQYEAKGSNADPSRTYTTSGQSYSDFTPGPVMHTNRDLDIAVSGKGFIAVQSKTGAEGYTRAGDLQINSDGYLASKKGDLVIGSSGPIQLGNFQKVNLGSDGTVTVLIKGETLPVTLDRIKLASPAITQLQKGNDGLFYLSGGTIAAQDDTVKVTPGALEGSNVNPVETLTSLIELSRQFEMHANLVKSLQDNSTKANEILQMPT